MSAYQSNVKVEPPCVARSARTPGSIVSSSTTFGMRGVAPAPHSSALRARPYRTGSLLTREGNHVFGNEQPKVARDMLVRAQRLAAETINSDITRRQPVISELILKSLLGVLNGNVSTTIISRKNDDNLKKNDNEIKIC